jgi:hypothetical protein
MSSWGRWAFGLLTLSVTVTGLAYLWMKYLLETVDPFAVVNHPWQGFMLAAHVILSPGLILVFGTLLNSHILEKLGARKTQNRKSGVVALATFFVMTGTGYLLQVVTSPLLMQTLVAAHVVSGGMFSLVYVVHLVVSVRLSRVQLVRRAEAA